MREIDRKRNGMAFPKLYYPELYLLEGGYKAFYELVPVSSTIVLALECVCTCEYNIVTCSSLSLSFNSGSV